MGRRREDVDGGKRDGEAASMRTVMLTLLLLKATLLMSCAVKQNSVELPVPIKKYGNNLSIYSKE